MNAHTPGPWKTKWPKYDALIVDAGGFIIASVSFCYHHDTECEANARLIAAAPEMAEIIEALIDAVHDQAESSGGGVVNWGVLQRARALLTRINGGVL